MIFKRKIYNKLLDWKTKSNGTKAILIEGARRIGKSTIAEEFGKNNYKSYVLIDFSKASPSIKEGFNSFLNDLDSLFLMISLEYGVTLYKRESLLIFDEVKAIIDDLIDCYNNGRCIWHLNKLPPKEFNETVKKIALLQWEDIIADSI